MPGLMRPFRDRRAGPLAALAALVATVGVTGCGASDPVRVQGHTINVRLEEFRFVPQVIRASAGRTTIRVTDAGVLAHNLKLIRRGVEVGGTDTIQHGMTASTTLTLKRGTYRMICSVANHDDLGMYGSLVVR
jgi:plastocyanin